MHWKGTLPNREGRIICSCFGVGEARIVRTVSEQGITDTAEIGRVLKCGTNCGSCLPELREIIARETPVATSVEAQHV